MGCVTPYFSLQVCPDWILKSCTGAYGIGFIVWKKRALLYAWELKGPVARFIAWRLSVMFLPL